ncbi:hypothetical protein, partial [Segatella sp.]|uniref:hypothetical protein n=1 Tax=Segatella sp. TaxID=2974253 RepID=UPI003AAC4CC9
CFKKGVKMILNEILTHSKLIAMIDFSNKEAEKILARAKELNQKAKALPDKDSVEGVHILMKTERLKGKLEGVSLVMEELERLAKIS